MQDVERAKAAEKLHDACRTPQSSDAADVVYCRTEQRVAARLFILRERDDVHSMARSQPLDQPQQRRDDAMRAGAINATGEDEGNFQRPSLRLPGCLIWQRRILLLPEYQHCPYEQGAIHSRISDHRKREAAPAFDVEKIRWQCE
jgi:hypothetical protein